MFPENISVGMPEFLEQKQMQKPNCVQKQEKTQIGFSEIIAKINLVSDEKKKPITP